jgi:hypothetical protein
MFNIFPKRAFAAEDMDAFRVFLQQHSGTASEAYRKKISLRTWVFLAAIG